MKVSYKLERESYGFAKVSSGLGITVQRQRSLAALGTEILISRGKNLSVAAFQKKMSKLFLSHSYLTTQLMKSTQQSISSEVLFEVLSPDNVSIQKNQVKLTIKNPPIYSKKLMAGGLFGMSQDSKKLFKDWILVKHEIFSKALGKKALLGDELEDLFAVDGYKTTTIYVNLFGSENLIKRILELDEKDEGGTCELFSQVVQASESVIMKTNQYASESQATMKIQFAAPKSTQKDMKTSSLEESKRNSSLKEQAEKSGPRMYVPMTLDKVPNTTSVILDKYHKSEISSRTGLGIGGSGLKSSVATRPNQSQSLRSQGVSSKIKIIEEPEVRSEVKHDNFEARQDDGMLQSRILDDVLNPTSVFNGDQMIYRGEMDATLQRDGKGIFIFPNGDRYEGEWKLDKCHGRGIMYFKLGTNHPYAGGRYEGEFRNNKLEGKGKYYNRSDILIYDGEVVDGMKHGRGIFLEEGNNWYDGCFSEDLKHGEGTYFVRNGSAYKGQWECGKKNGKFKVYAEWVLDQTKNRPVIKEDSKVKTETYAYDQFVKPVIIIVEDNGQKINNATPSREISEELNISTQKPAVAKRFGIDLMHEDFKTLDPEKHLSSKVIDCYLSAIDQKYQEEINENRQENSYDRIKFLDSVFYQTLTEGKPESDKTNWKGVSATFRPYSVVGGLLFEKYDRIFIPVEEEGKYWSLVEIYCEFDERRKLNKVTFRVYDPALQTPKEFLPSQMNATRHLYNFAQDEICKIKGENMDEYQKLKAVLASAKVIYPKITQVDKNVNDTGVIVCRVLQHLVAYSKNREYENLISKLEGLDAFRDEIKNVIAEKYRNPLKIDRQKTFQKK